MRGGHSWLTKHKSIMKSVMDVYFNHKNLICPWPIPNSPLKCFRCLSNYAPVPVLSLAVPVLSLVVLVLSLVVPVLSLAVPVMSLAAPLCSSVIAVLGQNNYFAAHCSLSLTMVETGAKLQIPWIKGGLVLIKMAVMN